MAGVVHCTVCRFYWCSNPVKLLCGFRFLYFVLRYCSWRHNIISIVTRLSFFTIFIDNYGFYLCFTAFIAMWLLYVVLKVHIFLASNFGILSRGFRCYGYKMRSSCTRFKVFLKNTKICCQPPLILTVKLLQWILNPPPRYYLTH